MAKHQKIQTNFSTGEISQRIMGHFDFAKYPNACRTLENMVCMPEGGVFRRPGLYYQADTKFHDKASRLVTFTYSDTDSYILEFGNYYVRFFRNWGQVLSGTDIYEIATPYSSSYLSELQFRQNADVMYIYHPSIRTRKLSRFGHTNWTIVAMPFERGPFLDENDTSTTINPSATTGDITLTASTDIFESTHIGSLWQLSFAKAVTPVNEDIASAASSSSVDVALGQTLDYSTHGTWTGTIALESSRDGGTTWEAMYTFASTNDENRTDSITEEVSAAKYRWTMLAYTSGTCKINLTPRAEKVNGVVEITNVISGTQAEATVQETLGDSGKATTLWAEGAWSDKRGWPRTGTFFEQRHFLAGTTYQPVTIWASISIPGGDFDNFLAGTDDDSAFTFSIAESQDPIKSLCADRNLIALTAGGPYSITGSGTNEGLTATKPPKTERQDISGATNIEPVKTSLGLLFVERGNKRVDELVYSWEADKFVTVNLTRLSEHIAGSGIKEISFQKRPERWLWCVNNDGDSPCLTYLRTEDIVGWSRITTDGYIESIATKPGAEATYNEDEDEYWCIVRRTINGQTKRYVERMMPWKLLEGDKEDLFYVDCGVTYDGVETSTITGLSHLEGKTVSILADGGVQSDKVVSSGQITLDNAASVVHVGLPYSHDLTPTRPIFGPLASGSTQKITRAAVMFYKTGGEVKFGESTDTKSISFLDSSDGTDSATALFTGTKDFTFNGSWQKEGDFKITGNSPLPCNVLSITLLVESN